MSMLVSLGGFLLLAVALAAVLPSPGGRSRRRPGRAARDRGHAAVGGAGAQVNDPGGTYDVSTFGEHDGATSFDSDPSCHDGGGFDSAWSCGDGGGGDAGCDAGGGDGGCGGD